MKVTCPEPPERRQVRIAELSDRYLVLDMDTNENLGDREGFGYWSSAKEWAEEQGFEVVAGI